LNNDAINSKILAHGDEIRIGSSVFRFVDSAVDDTLSGVAPDVQTVVLLQTDAIYLRAAPGSNNLPANSRTVRDLNALAALSRAVTSLRDLPALQDQILKSATDAIPAGRAAILLAQPDSDAWAQRSWDRRFGMGADFQASRTIVNRVLSEGVAILSNDIPHEEDFQAAQSLVIAQTRSVLAVPLEAFGDRFGVLYLDAAFGADFDQGHLQLLTAFGNVAALGIENVRHFEWLEGEQGSQTTSLCGRNAVQVAHRLPAKLNFEEMARHLRDMGGEVSFNRFMLKFGAESYEFTVFPDGRAIIKGTNDIDKARTLYAKYIGH